MVKPLIFLTLSTNVYLLMISLGNATTNNSENMSFSKASTLEKLRLNQEKLTHLHFYYHEVNQGANTTLSIWPQNIWIKTWVCFVDGYEPGFGRRTALMVRSTLSILSRNDILADVREFPIVGGSGVFRFALGYALPWPINLTSKYLLILLKSMMCMSSIIKCIWVRCSLYDFFHFFFFFFFSG